MVAQNHATQNRELGEQGGVSETFRLMRRLWAGQRLHLLASERVARGDPLGLIYEIWTAVNKGGARVRKLR